MGGGLHIPGDDSRHLTAEGLREVSDVLAIHKGVLEPHILNEEAAWRCFFKKPAIPSQQRQFFIRKGSQLCPVTGKVYMKGTLL